MGNYYLAVDIGASSGRHILAELKNGRMELEEVYRFQNGMQERTGALCWDHEYLFREIKNGLKKCKELGKIPQSVSVDTWGVDFVLLDQEDRVLGDTVGYRDSRTQGMTEKVETIISQEELYKRTGRVASGVPGGGGKHPDDAGLFPFSVKWGKTYGIYHRVHQPVGKRRLRRLGLGASGSPGISKENIPAGVYAWNGGRTSAKRSTGRGGI